MKSPDLYPHIDAANRYIKNVLAGKILACKWVKLACQRQLNDLKRQKDKAWPYRFDKKKAERICKFIELLPHTKGKWAAKQEKQQLEPWQSFILTTIFGWIDKKTLLRRFREGYVEVPRKNGKSLLAADIGLFMFCADGEFGAEVYSGATTEKQAWEIFRPAQLIAKRTPELCAAYGILPNASNLAILENGSRFEPLIGSPGDGPSPSCGLIDEYHEHKSDGLYETITTGMGAREQPLVLIITTAGSNLAGPCYMKHLEVQKILDGSDTDETIFAIIFTIDSDDVKQNDKKVELKEEDQWTSELALRKANPNYGISLSEDYLLVKQRAAMRSARKQNTFKTKHLNLWVGADSAWMDMLKWNQAPPRKPLAELMGRGCFIGVDLSKTTDITAVVLLFPPFGDDPLWHVHGRYYLPEEAIEDASEGNASHYRTWEKLGLLTLCDGDVIDYAQIKEDLLADAERFTILRAAFDPWKATTFMQDLATHKGFGDRWVKGKKEPICFEFAQTARYYTEPMQETERLVRQRLLAHGHCPIMTWMMSNVVVHEDKNVSILSHR